MYALSIDAGLTYLLLFISLYFEVFLLVTFLEQRKGSQKIASLSTILDKARLPHVAIIVPCFNEARTLGATLNSLLALTYPHEKLEILVVDDGSTDDTLAVTKSFVHDGRLRVFHKENGGKHSAMNFALQKTSAQLIGCLDADSTVEPDALMALVPMFANAAVAAVTPGMHAQEPRTIFQHIQKVEYRLGLFNRFVFAALGSLFITPGPFSFFRASVVRELGSWRHGHSTEDMEMALRIQEAGYLIANAPNAIVHTATPTTLRDLFHQRVRWTYGWLRNAIDYRHMIGNTRYGNLGLVILPSALISIATGIYFFTRFLWYTLQEIIQQITRIGATGVLAPHYTLDPFYINTSAFWFLMWTSVVMIIILICAGSFIGTNSRRPPIATPLFLLFYSFLAPLWLCTAVVRAIFRTGVRWR